MTSHVLQGFGVFNVDTRDFTGDGSELGARLLAPGRITGVLAGTFHSVVYGSFIWAGGTETYNMLVIDTMTGEPVFTWPGVWGAGIEGACWRDEKRGTFFVVGQVVGFQNSPQSGVMGVCSCSMETGCGPLSNGLRELPTQAVFSSVVYDDRAKTLYVMYLSTPSHGPSSAPNALLATYAEQSGWSYRSIFSTSALGGNQVPRLLLSQSRLWVNLDAMATGARVGSLFCPPDFDLVPPLIGTMSGASGCWFKAPAKAYVNLTDSDHSTQAVGLLTSVLSLTRSFVTGQWACRLLTGSSPFLVVSDCTFNLNNLALGKSVILSASGDTVFGAIMGAVNETVVVITLRPTDAQWTTLFSISDTRCTNYRDANDYLSPFSKQPPIQPTRDGSTIMYTCPFVSNAHYMPENEFTLFAYDVASNSTRVVSKQSRIYRAAKLTDMCVAGDTVLVRGEFFAIQSRRIGHLAAPSGAATWLPGSGVWKEVPTGVGQFESGVESSRCSVAGTAMWIPYVQPNNASCMSIGYYSCLTGEWSFAMPSCSLPTGVHGSFPTDGSGGHSRIALSPNGRMLYMVWRIVTTFDVQIGVVMQLELPENMVSAKQLEGLSWKPLAVLQTCDECFVSSFSNAIVYDNNVWVTGAFQLQVGKFMAMGIARFDPVSGEAQPVATTADEVVYISDAAVGSFVAGTAPFLWVAGSIKSVPSLGNAMNVAALDQEGNFTTTTSDLLSPPARLECDAIFFIREAMVTISRDGREGYGEFSAGMNIFVSGPTTYPDPDVQSMFFDVQMAAPIEVAVLSAPYTVALIVAVAVVIMAAISVLIPCVWRKAQNSGAFRYIVLPDYGSHGFNTNIGALMADDDILKLDAEDVVLGAPIGQGGQGMVRRATYRGKDIACKALFEFDAKLFANFLREIKLTSLISHPNVLNFIGVLMQDDVLWACSELMDTDLRKVMGQLTMEARTQVALDVASGMAYLHSFQPPIVHMDLKPSNVLISRTGSVKIADFGISRLAQASDKKSQPNDAAGTLIYMAPECFERDAVVGPQADVYAFGLVVLELFGVEPYGDATALHFYQFTEMVKSRAVVPNVAGLGPNVPRAIARVVQMALSFDAADRPSFAEIVTVLKKQ